MTKEELLKKLKETIYNIDYATNYDSPLKNQIANAIAYLSQLEDIKK